MKKIAVFDFDGTIIKRDSMILFFKEFFKFSFKSLPEFLKIIAGSIKYFLKIESQVSFKQKYINAALKYSRIKNIDELSDKFSDYLLKMVLPGALFWIKKLKEENYELVLCSASIDLYLDKIYKKLGFDKLICTKVIINSGKATIEKNCYGQNKIDMLAKHYENDGIQFDSSYCFSDGPSDKVLLKLFGNPYIVNNRRFYKNNPFFNFIYWN